MHTRQAALGVAHSYTALEAVPQNTGLWEVWAAGRTDLGKGLAAGLLLVWEELGVLRRVEGSHTRLRDGGDGGGVVVVLLQVGRVSRLAGDRNRHIYKK